MTVISDIKLGEYLWTCRYLACLCSYKSHVLKRVHVCICVCVFVLCSDFIFCNFSVIFWQGTLAMGLALKMTWVLERRVSGTAVWGWNQCRRITWYDLRPGWRGSIWIERIVWFSCCLFVVIWDKHRKCSRFRNSSSPIMISDSLFMVVEETISKYHKTCYIFSFVISLLEVQRSLRVSSSSFTPSSLYWVSDPVIHSARLYHWTISPSLRSGVKG